MLQDFAKAIQNVNNLSFELKQSVVRILIDKVIIFTKESPNKFYPEVEININWRFDALPYKIDYIENYTVEPFRIQLLKQHKPKAITAPFLGR